MHLHHNGKLLFLIIIIAILQIVTIIIAILQIVILFFWQVQGGSNKECEKESSGEAGRTTPGHL